MELLVINYMDELYLQRINQVNLATDLPQAPPRARGGASHENRDVDDLDMRLKAWLLINIKVVAHR